MSPMIPTNPLVSSQMHPADSHSFAFSSSPPPSPLRQKRERLSISLTYSKKRREVIDEEEEEYPPLQEAVGEDFKMLDGSRIDTATIPKAYLESFPYPAFVLVSPIPPPSEDIAGDELPIPPENHHVPFTRSTHTRIQPFDAIWGNDKWHNLTQGSRLLECVSVEEVRRLGDWISGARAVRGRDVGDTRSVTSSVKSKAPEQFAFTHNTDEVGLSLARTTISPRTSVDHGYPPAPEGFWEPEQPYEDKSSRSDGSSDLETGTGIEGPGGETPGSATVIIEMNQPARVVLEMTKTSLPIWQFGPNGARIKLETHTFIIITTVPRSPIISKGGSQTLVGQTPTGDNPHFQSSPLHSPADLNLLVPPFPHLKPTTTILSRPNSPSNKGINTIPRGAIADVAPAPTPVAYDLTPTDEIMALDLPPPVSYDPLRPGRALFFNRDGTVSGRGHSQKGKDANGKSLDVHELLKHTDWTQTPLGAMDQWPQSLKTIVSLVMQYPHQCCLWWGKDLTLIYNAPYAEVIHKHPTIFGMSGPVAWAEIWNSLGPLSELVLNGTPVYKEDDFLLFRQLPHQGNGTFEAYHTWMWVPVLQEDGSFGGLWNATIDTTSKVLAERRLATVREMGERTSIARTLFEFDSAVLEILGANPRDIPFALLYHVDLSSNERKPQSTTNAQPEPPKKAILSLAGKIGVPDGHPSALSKLVVQLSQRSRDSRATPGPFSHAITGSPTLSIVSSISNPLSANLSTANRSSTPDVYSEEGADTSDWPFREALQSRRLVLIQDCSELIQGYPVRVWDELPNAAVVVPIANDSDEGIPTAVAVIGLSIRRQFDDEYESFIHVMRLQLASGLAAVRSYEAERQRIDELAALDRAKSLLFSNVSHELRTPLTLVAGPLDDLISETKEGPKRETLLMARRNVRRLTRLVSTLMDVSRLEAGRLKGSFRPVNLGSVTCDLSALFRGAIEKARLKYTVECDLTSRETYVDPDHWEKIIFNLVGNALKYTMKGFIRVNLAYLRREAILTVQDSGVGIPTSDINLVGERFHRVQSVSRSHEGTGIGLALVKELIKLHGGTLEISSRTAAESGDGSHGSTFCVKIPIGLDHLPRDAIEMTSHDANSHTVYGQGIVDEAMQWGKDRDSSADSSSDSGGNESSAASSRGIDPATLYFKKEDTILLVDDSFDMRRYMRSIFAPFCKVVEANDGQEALDLCKKTMPDLVISDVMMPVLDGFGLLSAIRADEKLRVLPVIMLTARGGGDAKVEGLLAGADDYLSKPFNAAELIARAHMQLQLGKRRRNLEDAFEERTAELRTLAEYSPGGIFRCDQNGKVTYTNSAWHELSGYPVGTEVDNWGDYILPQYRRMVSEFWETVYNSDSPTQTGEWQFTNGRWVTVTIIRLDMAAPGLKGILGCVTDITERRLHEESQRERMIEAEERRLAAEEAKRQQELLIDITSHEIRNPISSLMQCSALVKTNLLSLQEQLELSIKDGSGFRPTQQLLATINEDLDALESIYQCGLTQERISNDVLSLGRIQLDMLQMFDVETDIDHEAQKVISIFQNEARMKRISLSLNLGESIKRLGIHHIKTDPVRLGQVVTNLLSNGIRFTSNSSTRKIELKFDLSFDPPEDQSCLMARLPERPATIRDDMPIYLYVAVTDTGPGLTPKDLELLFQRFSQVSPKTHTIFGGSGLGLFVCRKITEIMGGRIEVASEHGHGSTFRFFIQARTCQTSKRAIDSTEVAKLPKSPKKRHLLKRGVAGPKPHVLIVEDNLINQTVLMRQLKHIGLTCEVANNGLEALERVRQVATNVGPREGQMFDCILMDLEMPIMDGLTALRHIREEEAEGKLALNLVIALTGNARQGQIDEAKAAGMDDVVIKPYRLDDLLVKIEEMMKLRATRAAVGDVLSVA